MLGRTEWNAPDNNTVALVLLAAITIVAILAKVEGAKEISIAVVAGITGWLARGKTDG
jgi:EamA domain-containing membrane protein RarD